MEAGGEEDTEILAEVTNRAWRDRANGFPAHGFVQSVSGVA